MVIENNEVFFEIWKVMVLGLVLRCEDGVEFVKICNLSIDYICYLVGKINLLN